MISPSESAEPDVAVARLELPVRLLGEGATWRLAA